MTAGQAVGRRAAGEGKVRRALIEAGLVAGLVLALFAYWFGVANRHVIFLYEHTATGIPRAEPFDAMTASRYWMAGLVAAGVVMVLYAAAHWLLGWAARRRQLHWAPPPWPQVWGLCALPLAIGIPAITMTVNRPTLPPGLAAATTAATLLGLALALMPGEWAATRPADLAWLAAEALGLMPALLLLRVVELPGRGLSVSGTLAWAVAGGGLAAGALWLAGMRWLRRWRRAARRKAQPTAGALLAAGLGLSYVLMPLVHHLLGTPPAYRYITTASNFFAFNWGVQAAALAAAGLMAVGATGALSATRRLPE